MPLGTEEAVSSAWTVVLLVGAFTISFKAAGPVLLGGRVLPERLSQAFELLAPSLLAALVVTQAVGGKQEIVLDTRLVGVAAGTVAILLRAPLIVVIIVAALSTALARLL
jgi:branched chain amino acid efflux pump